MDKHSAGARAPTPSTDTTCAVCAFLQPGLPAHLCSERGAFSARFRVQGVRVGVKGLGFSVRDSGVRV